MRKALTGGSCLLWLHIQQSHCGLKSCLFTLTNQQGHYANYKYAVCGWGGGNKEPWIVFRLSILLALFAPAGNQVSCLTMCDKRESKPSAKKTKKQQKILQPWWEEILHLWLLLTGMKFMNIHSSLAYILCGFRLVLSTVWNHVRTQHKVLMTFRVHGQCEMLKDA